MTDLAQRLARRTLELIDIPSESGDEAAIHAHVRDLLRDGGVEVVDAADSCLLAGPASDVVLAGHFDTVPAQDNRPGRIAGGTVHGLGAADMLGAVAVIVELLLDGAPGRGCLFGREELTFSESALTPLLAREPALAERTKLAIVMEPTAGAVHAGCVGNLNATVTFPGTAGHSARPWLADNAIHNAAPGIAAVAAVPVRDVESDGLVFREVVSVTTVHGGIARNVIPGTCVAEVNLRYAPDTSAEGAERQLRELLEPFGDVRIDGNAPSAPAALDAPLARAFGADLEIAPKQAWTPVAEFAQVGVPALNFGPGEPRFAHRADEQVEIAALVAAYDRIAGFLQHV